MLNRFFNQTITRKMNQIFVFITIISTIFSSIAIYQYSKYISLKESRANALDLSEQLNDNFETARKSLEEKLYIKASFIESSSNNAQSFEDSYKKENFYSNLLWNFLYGDIYVEAVTIVDNENKKWEISVVNGSPIASSAFSENDAKDLKLLYGRCDYLPYDNNHILIRRALYSPIDTSYVGYGVFLINTDYFSAIFESSRGTKNFAIVKNNLLYFATNYDLKVSGKMITEERNFWYQDKNYYVSSTVPDEDGWIISCIMSTSQLTESIQYLPYMILAISIFSLIIAYIISFFVTRRITAGVNNLAYGYQRAARGALDIKLSVIDEDEVGEMTILFNKMVEEIATLIKEVKEQEHLKSEALIRQMEFQYNALQSQLNPHFLYNSLEIINSSAKMEGNYAISEVVCTLGRLLRVAMETNVKMVPLSDELAYTKDYLEIYKLTHSGEVVLDINVEDELLGVEVPKLLLEPLVENALIHGFKGVNDFRIITIDCFVDSQLIYIQIQDNGIGMSEEEINNLQNSLQLDDSNSAHIGVESVYKRLKILYGKRCDFSFVSEKGNGTVFTLQLPLKENIV